jgi:hypothetical protein
LTAKTRGKRFLDCRKPHFIKPFEQLRINHLKPPNAKVSGAPHHEPNKEI